MYRGDTVGVILPAYNEAEHVGPVIESLPSYVDRVYAIDDCSTDETWQIIQKYATEIEEVQTTVPGTGGGPDQQVVLPDGYGRDIPAVIPVQHSQNRGAGGTLKTGYELVHRDGMDIAVTIDADGQMDPSQMDRLLDPIVEGKADFSKGNRLADAEVASEMPRFRLLGNWLLTMLMKPASGYWRLRDPQNGYTAISHDALSSIDIAAIPSNHDYPNDLITRLHAAGFRIADVRMEAIYGAEESTIQFSEFVRETSRTMADSFFWRLKTAAKRGRPHLPGLYAVGLVTLVVGTLATVVQSLSNWGAGSTALGSGIPATVLPLFAGALALLAAIGVDEHGDAEVIQA